MPHRAGYFVLAYSWDHHCHEIFESIQRKFNHVERELSEMKQDGRGDTDQALLNYYKKWHYNNELFQHALSDIGKKQFVINSLGYRGYGVNRDLLAGLGELAHRHNCLAGPLGERFDHLCGTVCRRIYLPREIADLRKADYIITEFCKMLGKDPADNIPTVQNEPVLDLDRYMEVMSRETSWQINTAIFQKMFLSLGSSSITLMKGSTGLHNGRSSQELKLLGNKNFVGTVREIFSTLHEFTAINLDLLKKIHWSLSQGLDVNAGNFRQIDFPDRNGVTFEFDNFHREVSDLAIVLSETAASFHHLHEFIYNLARSYYMLIGIHPFWDSNGRVGRCFLNSLLVKKGLPPVTLNDDEEVQALPRYGGTMEDMHRYLKKRLQRAIETYFYERWKLEHFGFLDRKIHNVSFDSGFHFRQIAEDPPKIEVHFTAFVIPDSNGLSDILKDQCRIVLPEEGLLYGITIHCGFCSGPFSEWRHCFSLKKSFYIKELAPEFEGARTFDVDFVIAVLHKAGGGEYFSCCVVSEERGLIFNNKGINYSYRLGEG
jgi:fido (protein-threonine AMPylation protein)